MGVVQLADSVITFEETIKRTTDRYDKKFNETEIKFRENDTKHIEIDVKFNEVITQIDQETEIREYKMNELKEDIIKNQLANNLSIYKSIVSLRIICNIFMIYLLIVIPRTWPVSVPVLIWSIFRMYKETPKYTLLQKENDSL